MTKLRVSIIDFCYILRNQLNPIYHWLHEMLNIINFSFSFHSHKPRATDLLAPLGFPLLEHLNSLSPAQEQLLLRLVESAHYFQLIVLVAVLGYVHYVFTPRTECLQQTFYPVVCHTLEALKLKTLPETYKNISLGKFQTCPILLGFNPEIPTGNITEVYSILI